jgi:enterochelin esterase-like enzyme
MKSMMFLCALFVCVLLNGVNAITPGNVTTYKFWSNVENRNYTVNIYYPPGYLCSNLRYPIIYLLHGHSGDHTDWVDPLKGDIIPTANALFRSGVVQPAVLVIPGDQYSWWINSLTYRQAETAFLTELMPYVENTLLVGRVFTNKAGRMIGGLSAGGYASIRFCMLYPELWISSAPLSPAIYSPNPTTGSSALGAQSPYKGYDGLFNSSFWQSLNWPSYIDMYVGRGYDDLIPMYLNSGDYDRFRIAYHVTYFFNTLWNLQPNITKLVVQLRIVSGDHDWPVWRSTIGDAMAFMLHYASQPMSLGAPTVGDGPGCIAVNDGSSGVDSSSGGVNTCQSASVVLYPSMLLMALMALITLFLVVIIV